MSQRVLKNSKQSTAVKKAWSQANKLHKAIQLEQTQVEGWDSPFEGYQGVKSTPGLARRFNSLIKKGQVLNAGGGLKRKTIAYSKWLAEMQAPQSPAASEQPRSSREMFQISSQETKTNPTQTPEVITQSKSRPIIDLQVLENLSQTCRQFQITPNELVAHINILEQLQVLDTTCVQNS